LEEIHLHEHVNSFVVATLVIRRNNVPSPTEEPEDFRRFVELTQALVKMGKL
jgi:hypothetical protein